MQEFIKKFKQAVFGDNIYIRPSLLSEECYPYWVRQSVMHRDGWSQTNGWALMAP